MKKKRITIDRNSHVNFLNSVNTSGSTKQTDTLLKPKESIKKKN